MRRTSARTLNLLTCALIFCGGAQFARTQTRDVRLISARAGGVNFVAGTVTVKRVDGAVATLTMNDDLRSGDVVATGVDGRVEVLLNPGSYLRLAENSEFELVDNSLDNLRLRLNRGAAVAEVIGFEDEQPVVSLATPQTKIVVVKSGIYHVKVFAPDTTELAVRKGGALVGNSTTVVKGGKKAIINGSNAVALVKLTKQETDALDDWSRARAEFLAKANARMTGNPTLVSALTNWRNFDGRSNGVWGYDGLVGGWSFIPINRWYLSCPYGYNYNNRLIITQPNRADCPGCTQETGNVRRGGGTATIGDNSDKRGGTDRFPLTMTPAPQAPPASARPERSVETERVTRESPHDNMRPPL